MMKTMRKIGSMGTSKEVKDKWEEFYKTNLKDFAIHYVALWNSLRSLGLSDPQIKGAISILFEVNGISFKEAVDIKKGKQDDRN